MTCSDCFLVYYQCCLFFPQLYFSNCIINRHQGPLGKKGGASLKLVLSIKYKKNPMTTRKEIGERKRDETLGEGVREISRGDGH